MDATNSDLSSSKYGYDFVVSTTQASINSGLLQYLNECTQPETCLCFQVVRDPPAHSLFDRRIRTNTDGKARRITSATLPFR